MNRKLISLALAGAMASALCISAGAAEPHIVSYDKTTGITIYKDSGGSLVFSGLPDVGEAESAHKAAAAGRYSYDCCAVLNYGSLNRGSVWAVEKNGQAAPAALRVTLYEGDAVLSAAGWSVTGGEVHYLTTGSRPAAGDVRVEGEYRLYHPDSTDYTYGTAPTAFYSQKGSADARGVVTAYAVNDRGETYGSYLDRNAVGYAPDLVKAKGMHDRYGYLRLEDYAPELDSVEELVRWQTQVDRDNLIPLYDLEGNVIDFFALGTSQEQAEIDPAMLARLNELSDGNGKSLLNNALPAAALSRDYPTNAQGQTYGSYLDREKYGYAPDLIKAIGDNGRSGYLPLQQFRSARSRVLNLLDLNGSVVDTFTIEDGEHSS